jgi:predicted SprT family Zn-dependent metalloprotease
MNLNDAKKLARQLMDDHGAKDVPLVISGGKTQLGACHFVAGPSLQRGEDIINDIFGLNKRNRRINRIERLKTAKCKCIKLSRYLVDLNGEDEVRETMLHEIAHFLVGATHGHDAVWRRKAIEIGCNGERLAKTAIMPKGRYKASCQCGKVYYKHRKGKNIFKKNWFRCRICKNTVQFVDTMAREIA